VLVLVVMAGQNLGGVHVPKHGVQPAKTKEVGINNLNNL
jgi:hypothetical protein